MQRASIQRTASEKLFDQIMKELQAKNVCAFRLNAVKCRGGSQPGDYIIIENGTVLIADLKETQKEYKYKKELSRQYDFLHLANLNHCVAGFLVFFCSTQDVRFLPVGIMPKADKFEKSKLPYLSTIVGERMPITCQTIQEKMGKK